MKAISALLNSRKFVALASGTLTSIVALSLTKYVGNETAIQLGEQIAGMIMVSVAIYAGSQAYEDSGNKSIKKEENNGV